MEKVQKVLSNCTQGLTAEEKAQARENIGVNQYTAGANIDISGNTISVTGLADVAYSGSYTDLTQRPDITEIIVDGYIEPNPHNVKFKNNGTVEALMGGTTHVDLGIMPPIPEAANAGDVLTATYDVGTGKVGTAWQPAQGGGDGRLLRHDAELYYYGTWQGDGQNYHVRNVANNCLNHVAVDNLSGVICNLVIEAPSLDTDEEYNYTVQFDCTNSSGFCSCSVENAAPKIYSKYQLDQTSQWLRVTGAANPSDAINPEIRVVDMVNPNYINIVDGNGQTQNVVYSVGHSEKYLRIESASYSGGGSIDYAGPNVITSVDLRNNVDATDTTVNFSGSPTYQIRVHGNVWEIVRF